MFDALEEYYGAITNASRFSDAVTADGERLLELDDLSTTRCATASTP